MLIIVESDLSRNHYKLTVFFELNIRKHTLIGFIYSAFTKDSILESNTVFNSGLIIPS